MEAQLTATPHLHKGVRIWAPTADMAHNYQERVICVYYRMRSIDLRAHVMPNTTPAGEPTKSGISPAASVLISWLQGVLLWMILLWVIYRGTSSSPTMIYTEHIRQACGLISAHKCAIVSWYHLLVTFCVAMFQNSIRHFTAVFIH